MSGATQADLSQGKAAKLTRRDYKQSGVKGTGGAVCDYDVSWVTVTNLSPSVRNLLNGWLLGGPNAKDATCKDTSMTLEGGYQKNEVNAGGVLSVVYRFSQYTDGTAHPENVTLPFNLDLGTGKPIELADILTDAGRKTFTENCTKQLRAAGVAGGVPDLAEESPNACEFGLAPVASHYRAEAFSITKQGLRAQLDSFVARAYLPLLPADGFLIEWKELGAGLKSASPVKDLAGR